MPEGRKSKCPKYVRDYFTRFFLKSLGYLKQGYKD